MTASPPLALPEAQIDPFDTLPPPMAPAEYGFGLNSLFEMQLGGPAYNGSVQQPFMDPLFGFSAFSPGRVDGQDSGLQLATDDGMFWSAFLSPPNPIATAELDATGDLNGDSSTSLNAPTPRRGRIMVAATGVATRHGSPAPQEEGGESLAGPSKAWPVWNPAEKDSGITVETVADHPPGLAGEIDEDVRMSILETLRFAQLTDHEYHSLYRTMSRLKLETYNTLLRLYFLHFHPVVPFLHIPSFNPRSTVGFLLLVILAIGAVHAPLAGALQLGRVLLEVSRRGIEHLTNRDNRLARSLPMSQALLLWSTIKWLGSPRLLELSEVFRCTFVTQLRRLQVFDEPSPALSPNASVQERWASFVASEERRRTGMACFLLESEFTTLMHLSPTLVLGELKTSLPCSEELWNAPTAEAWDALNQPSPPALQVGALFRLITADSPFPLPASIRLNPFACHLLVNAIHLLVWSSAQLSFIPNVAELAATNVRRSLSRLGRGENEFTPSFGATEGESKFSAACVSYHLAHIATHLRLEELDVVAGRWSALDAASAKAKIVSWMVSNGEQARIVALHAGQLVRLVHLYPTYGTYESSSLFYAALCLHLYARSLLISSSGFASTSSDTTVYALDSPQNSPSDPSIFIATGGPHPPSLNFEGIGPLTDSAASKKILTTLASALAGQTGAVWRIGQVLASVLLVIAGHEEST
ncbi:fungal-specific transcription factor domain-domain-containing protein [Leucosporidium creatinivorum]|uniref:Fungal-specific transcription factor domain-domain-containing protein n=1 Tax=Leucosporidium creatinivorum TaxID=106004 RepID=A0A1Y2G4C2_9BASI|nr:fungal-specific transcription factor domain-domain-containing protein [Leucosporidium creatinivorum]